MRYRSDVIGNNQIGGFGCDLDQQALWRLDGHKSPLQSWYEELEHYRSLNSSDATQCDVTISAKTYIVKLDAAVNMYHHFCDFVNLYATLHLNDDLLGANQDHVQILLWDTQQYRSPFAPTWAAITGKPVWNLAKFAGQRVCFRRVVFPLLPRMIFGLYYNMPLQPGCHGSGLIHAFARHVTHRLGVHQLLELQQTENERPIRVTFISRSTDYRRVLNEGELIQRLNEKAPSPMNLRVRIVDYGNIPFEQQLQITLNTDILIGMHGAGLTHLLFLPDWAVVFELFHCDDPRCYSDLARLRGLHYLTWHNRSKIESQPASPHAHRPAHLKFTNFRFDPDEFVRLTLLAAFHVKQHRAAYIQRSLSNNDTMSTHSFVPNTTHHEL